MHDFTTFSKAVFDKFNEMSKGELFTTDADLWEVYLESYPKETNPIIKERRLYDCQNCKHFIRRVGGVVTLKEGTIVTIWGGHGLTWPFNEVAEGLNYKVQQSKVTGVFRIKETQIGVEYNYGKEDERHDHFWVKIDKKHQGDDTKKSELAAIAQVCGRGLKEIRENDLLTVLELIASNGLYRGEEHKEACTGFLSLLQRYDRAKDQELFVWENLMHRFARFRNTVIGTLLVDLANGVELDAAVRMFETKVAPANYKRPTSVITQKMVEEAVQKLTDLGLHGAISRRYARLSDVSVNDVLFVDNEVKLKDNLTETLLGSVKKPIPDLKHATKIPVDDFIGSVLPGTRFLSCFVENRHTGNFVSLTGSDGPERLFKWDNNFAWSYDGDVTDSVKQRVKAAGGKIDCLLRVSLSWFNTDDLDLHCITPNGQHIYFGNKYGILDVDMNAVGYNLTKNPVENLAFNTLRDGVYKVHVNQFRRRETTDFGFAIEIEFSGVLNQYSYPKAMRDREDVPCFNLHIANGSLVKIEASLEGGTASQDKWGVKTESLVPVAAVMYSPNHWGGTVGARHLILALKGCKNPGTTRGVYNEFLRPEFEKHRKVFEVLGAKTKCPYSDEQVSGLGFTAARGDSVTVVADGRPFLVSF